MKRIFMVTLGIFLFLSTAEARKWKRLPIPGAFCANGQPYSVLYNLKNPKKLAIEMMGGGACWSRTTCHGPFLTGFTFMIPNISNYSKLTKGGSILANHSMVYFPYCNGDIFGGEHLAYYKEGSPIYHTGYTNVLLAIKELKKKRIINKRINDLVVYGSSAGSIGSLIHAQNFAKEVNPHSKKSLIIDSPGLHWTDSFWEKFSDNLIQDFKKTFNRIGISLDENDGMMADQVDEYCRQHPDWNIGFMTSEGDLAMSWIYGGIKSKTFKQLVYSDRGILKAVEDQPNCSAWVHPSVTHTFLLVKPTYKFSVDGISAQEFVNVIYHHYPSRNFFQRKLISK